jgi:glycosyltransferase involved in cell wall biosynthesis
MKVALVYDRVNKFGGAERVLLALHKIFPEAPLYTLVYNPRQAVWANEFKVVPTFLNKIWFLKNKHEWLAPISALAFESLDLREYDVVISVTSSDAKAVITKPNQLHICYCLTPNRYFWSGEGEYSKDRKMKMTPRWLRNYFRTVDLLISGRPDKYIAISNEVKERIRKYYNRDASVIYPSIDDKFYSSNFIPASHRENYLIVSRLVPYKKVDLAIKAFNLLKKPLTVVGSGSELSRLRKIAGPSITFTGAISDDKLIDHYRHAKAVIFPQEEDYGLIPIEAQACGTPVIAFAKGGALETIVSDKTGLFFQSQSPESLADAVRKFEAMSFSPSDCFQNALKFNNKTFSSSFKKTVDKLWSDYLANPTA